MTSLGGGGGRTLIGQARALEEDDEHEAELLAEHLYGAVGQTGGALAKGGEEGGLGI